MRRFCENCGVELNESDAFCQRCGHAVTAQNFAEAPAQSANYDAQNFTAPAPNASYAPAQSMGYSAAPVRPRKGKAGLIIGVVAGVLVITAALVLFLVPGILSPAGAAGSGFTGELLQLPSDLKVGDDEVNINCTYDSPDIIVPALYRSMDYVVFLKCWTDFGDSEAIVTVEIPDFTQKYEQKIRITRAETQLKIHPPLVEGVAKTLNSSKSAQIKVTVTDVNTGKVIVQDSKPIQLNSRYDMQWADVDGTQYHENFLAWLTPEAPEVGALLRDSADSLSYLTGGYLTSIVGYQTVGEYALEDMSYAQACAIMYTLANTYQVKYVASPFSATDTNLQRVKTPAEVINTRAGLCCETAVTVASALQATQMHAVLILLPGHMQTAVEAAPYTGEYYLIETTALDAAATGDFSAGNPIISYLTKDEWLQYISQEGYEVIDCAMAQELNIQSID